jgi:hypothetical protein
VAKSKLDKDLEKVVQIETAVDALSRSRGDVDEIAPDHIALAQSTGAPFMLADVLGFAGRVACYLRPAMVYLASGQTPKRLVCRTDGCAQCA